MIHMAKRQVTVTVEERLMGELDQLVQRQELESRSAGMEAALSAFLAAQSEARYERALAALTPEDVGEMQAMAEEGLADWSKQLAESPW